jgi:hypothetical protein
LYPLKVAGFLMEPELLGQMEAADCKLEMALCFAAVEVEVAPQASSTYCTGH